jgi:hypothetical protein
MNRTCDVFHSRNATPTPTNGATIGSICAVYPRRCSWLFGIAALLLSSVVLAEAPRSVTKQPAALDDAGWASLQQAVAMSIGQQAQLLAADGAEGAQNGYSVSLSGDTALVGAWRDDVGGNADQGSAFVYRRSGSTWTQQAQLLAADGATNDNFGSSVAIFGDTVLVGARGDSFADNPSRGSAYVFTRFGSIWTQQAKLVAGDGAVGDFFGFSVALSTNTALVGAIFDDRGANVNQGSAYVFTRSGTAWTQQAQLLAADGEDRDEFGSSVALSGSTALVGARGDDVGSSMSQGSAYVYTRSGSTWTQQAQLVAADGTESDRFGNAVALSGDTALVGAAVDDIGANVNQGSAYVYVRSGSTWTQQARLLAAAGAFGDQFGISVALSGDTVLIGALLDDSAQGSAYAFTRSGATWTQQAKLLATDGVANDQFGSAVALSGDVALVGAQLDDVGTNVDQGSAYVFTRSGALWTQQAQLLASDGAGNEGFGISVAISGDTALVGAWLDQAGVTEFQGSAYVYVRSGSTWTQQAQLLAADGAMQDRFGISVALSGDTALVGAWLDDVGGNADQGSAYVFVRGGSTWTQQAQLLAADGAGDDGFGFSVALSGNTALVGARTDDVGGNTNQGSAYVYTRSGSNWSQHAQLLAADGAANDWFGDSVALFADTALVGSTFDDVGANADQGSAYVYVRSGSSWAQQAQLLAADGAAGDRTSWVALSGDTALVGASSDDVGGNVDQGSAYIYTRSGLNWTPQAQLLAADGAAGDRFGSSVALSGDTALVGATFDDVGANINQGTATVYERSGSSWTQQAQVLAADGSGNHEFGRSVALSGDTALVGAHLNDVGVNFIRGSAYVYVIPPAARFTVGGKVTGLAGSGLLLSNNGDALSISADGVFTFSTAVLSGGAYDVTVVTDPSNPSQRCGVTRGSGTVSSANITDVDVTCVTGTFRVGGTVTGLSGDGLVLRNNGGDNLAIVANGAFIFSTRVISGGTYAVTVLTQPGSPTQTCTVTNGSGTVGAANVTNVAVNCVTRTFTVGGTATGLSGTGLVLRNNGGNNLTVAANGAFTFSMPVASGGAYAVTVFTQPTSPAQTCTVSNGSGTVGGANVTSITVNCVTRTFTVGGTVTGLSGSGLVLRNNGGNSLSVAANGSFTFTTPVASGAAYAVTVLTQPSNPAQTCTVSNGSGTVGAANVSNVAVNCVTGAFTVGGTVTGLLGSGMILRNNGGNNLSVTANGSFTFTTPVASGSPYVVSVFVRPDNPTQTCAVINGSGTVGGANVVNVQIACTTSSFTVGGNVSGLIGSGLVLRNNGGDNLAVAGNGSFMFGAPVASGGAYAVTVFTQPGNPAQICVVTNGSGTITSTAVTNVGVTCAGFSEVIFRDGFETPVLQSAGNSDALLGQSAR